MLNRVQLLLPGWKDKVVTLSYDDGTIHDRKLIQLLNQYGLKGTFHLSSEKFGLDTDNFPYISEDEVKVLYYGHEVACHTKNHSTLPLLSNEQIISEILLNKKALERLVHYPIRGFSYPMGVFDERVQNLLSACGIRYGRTTRESGRFDLPLNPFAWESTCHHNHSLLQKTEEFINRERKNTISLLYVWGHSYEFKTDNNWSLIENFCQLIQHHPEIWCATNIQIIDYFSAFKQLQISVDGSIIYNPTATDLYLLNLEKNERIVSKAGKTLYLISKD